MSPVGQSRAKSTSIPNNLYTAILAVACGVVVATMFFVAYMCHQQYGVILGTP